MAADLQAAREEKSNGKDFNLKSQEEKKYPETQKTVYVDVWKRTKDEAIIMKAWFLDWAYAISVLAENLGFKLCRG